MIGLKTAFGSVEALAKKTNLRAFNIFYFTKFQEDPDVYNKNPFPILAVWPVNAV